MKPLIGIMPLWDDDKESIWMLPGYLDGIREAGGLPIIFPLSSDENDISRLVSMCDGILFTGGHDVSPKLYGEEALKDLISCSRERDDMESCVLRIAMAESKSILGICRGIQFINAALGGTLYQDLPLQHPSSIEHHQTAPYDVPIHTVSIERETPLYDCLGMEIISVNSYHHQAVKELADGLEAMAYAPDGLIEALHKPDYPFLWAVQWHPEFSFRTDESNRKIFRTFVEAAV